MYVGVALRSWGEAYFGISMFVYILLCKGSLEKLKCHYLENPDTSYILVDLDSKEKTASQNKSMLPGHVPITIS